jgi:hypothetical protein
MYIFIFLCWLCNWLLQLLSQHIKIKNWTELKWIIIIIIITARTKYLLPSHDKRLHHFILCSATASREWMMIKNTTDTCVWILFSLLLLIPVQVCNFCDCVMPYFYYCFSDSCFKNYDTSNYCILIIVCGNLMLLTVTQFWESWVDFNWSGEEWEDGRIPHNLRQHLLACNGP